MSGNRIDQQRRFIVETDELKNVSRRTRPIGQERRENSAEHSWQVALSALVFSEYANEEIDLLRVIKMLLIHDIPEVDVGDVFHYDKDSTADLASREAAAAERLFGLLPADQGEDFLALWHEFEKRQTPEARYAAAVDRLMAFLVNSGNAGGTWREYRLAASKVLEKNSHAADGAKPLWILIERIVGEARKDGHLT